MPVQEYGPKDPSNQAATYPQRISPTPDTFGSDNPVGHEDPHTKLYEGTETKSEIEEIVETGLPPIHKKTLDHIFFLFRPLVKPVLEQISKLEEELHNLIDDMRLDRTFVDRPFNISQNVPYIVDYKRGKFLYIMCQQPLTLIVAGNNVVLTPARWTLISFPLGTYIYAAGVNDGNPVGIMVRSSNFPIPLDSVFLAGGTNFIGNVQLATGSNSVGNVGIEALNDSGVEEQWRSNNDFQSVLASQSFAVGTTNSSDFPNVNWRGLIIFLNVTAIGTGTIQLVIQGKDPGLGAAGYYTIVQDAFAITANGFYAFIVYPGVTPIASTSGTVPGSGAIRTAVSQIVPRTYRVQVIVATAAVTAQVDYAGEL